MFASLCCPISFFNDAAGQVYKFSVAVMEYAPTTISPYQGDSEFIAMVVIP